MILQLHHRLPIYLTPLLADLLLYLIQPAFQVLVTDLYVVLSQETDALVRDVVARQLAFVNTFHFGVKGELVIGLTGAATLLAEQSLLFVHLLLTGRQRHSALCRLARGGVLWRDSVCSLEI